MKPDDQVVSLAPGCITHALAETGRQYAILIEGLAPIEVALALPPGRYRAQWISILEETSSEPVEFEHTGRLARLTSPVSEQEIALKVVSVE